MTGLRVVQWATGNIGSRSLKQIIEDPGLELAGVYVTSAAKAGKDAGDLCGLPPTGVTATSDVDEILALGADCVLYMPAVCDLDQVCAILAAGTNIVTTRGEFHHPGSMPPADRERVERACAEGGTSIHSTGSSPGFISEAMPLVLTSIQRRIDRVAIHEYADVSDRDSPDMLFNLMGFGHQAAEFPPERFGLWRLLVRAVDAACRRCDRPAAGLGHLDRGGGGHAGEAHHRGGTLDAGTVAGLRMTVTGTHQGQPLMTFTASWCCSQVLDPAWDLRGAGWNGWNVQVDGDAPVDVDIRFKIPEGRMGEMTPGYTANRPVNAVPYVCAAAPGIRTTVDLPQIIPALGGGGLA